MDDDYPGETPAGEIKNELVALLKRHRQNFMCRQVVLRRVKGLRADLLARRVFLAKQGEGRIITLQEILAVWE